MRPVIVLVVVVVVIVVVVKDLRLKDGDKDKDLMSNDEDLKTGPRASSRTRTFLEDNNTVNTGSQIHARVF